MAMGIPVLQEILNVKPDLVISGMNNFANLGMDLHRSGTFGAAREARINGIPSIAISDLHGLESRDSIKKRLSPIIARLPQLLEFLKDN